MSRLTSLSTIAASVALTLPLALGAAACGNGDDSSNTDGGGGDDAKADAAVDTASTVVKLTSLDALSYSAPIHYGAQTLNVIVDTGSSTTGVAGSTCTSCQVDTRYTVSSTAIDEHGTASATYGDGTMWNGEIYKDTVALGGGPDVAIKFASITDDTGFFRGGYDGIMGFGPDSALLPGTTSYVTGAIAGGLNSEIAFQLCPDTGSLWLGGYDPKATTASPVYSNMDIGIPFSLYYAVQVAGASLGSADLGIAAADFGPTIIDTGTSISFVPAAALTKIENGVKASSGYKAVFKTQSLTSQDGIQTTLSSAEVDAMLPPFELTFPNSSTPVSVPATQSYLAYEGSQNGQNFYAFAFDDSSQLFEGEKASLFGDTLLAGMVAIFDIGNKQVGFAPQAGCHAADVARRERPVIKHTPGAPWWKDDPRIHLPANLPIKLNVGAAQ